MSWKYRVMYLPTGTWASPKIDCETAIWLREMEYIHGFMDCNNEFHYGPHCTEVFEIVCVEWPEMK